MDLRGFSERQRLDGATDSKLLEASVDHFAFHSFCESCLSPTCGDPCDEQDKDSEAQLQER